MNRIRFTKAIIDTLTVGEDGKRVFYYDDKVRGLTILIAAKTKTFYLLRKHQGKTERILLGRYPDTTIEQARIRASQTNGELDSGLNRNEVKRLHRAELTLNDLHQVDFTRSARQIIMSKTERSKPHEGYQIYGRV